MFTYLKSNYVRVQRFRQVPHLEKSVCMYVNIESEATIVISGNDKTRLEDIDFNQPTSSALALHWTRSLTEN